MLLIKLGASVDLLQSHNFLSSFAASLDSTGVIIFSSCEHYRCVATFLVGNGIYTCDLHETQGHESGINSYDGSGSMMEVEARWKWKHDGSGKWKW